MPLTLQGVVGREQHLRGEQCQPSLCPPRFCGNVAPPTFNTNSNHLRVTFVSDSSVGASGFSAHYRAVPPSESEHPHPRALWALQ